MCVFLLSSSFAIAVCPFFTFLHGLSKLVPSVHARVRGLVLGAPVPLVSRMGFGSIPLSTASNPKRRDPSAPFEREGSEGRWMTQPNQDRRPSLETGEHSRAGSPETGGEGRTRVLREGIDPTQGQEGWQGRKQKKKAGESGSRLRIGIRCHRTTRTRRTYLHAMPCRRKSTTNTKASFHGRDADRNTEPESERGWVDALAIKALPRTRALVLVRRSDGSDGMDTDKRTKWIPNIAPGQSRCNENHLPERNLQFLSRRYHASERKFFEPRT